jgi:hypothetical protein
MLYFIYTIIKHGAILLTICTIIIALEIKLNILNPNDQLIWRIIYFIGGLCTGIQLHIKLMSDNQNVTVTLEQENLEK